MYLPNRLSDFALNSMNLSKTMDFLYTRYKYPNLELLSTKVIVPLPTLCMNTKSSTHINMH